MNLPRWKCHKEVNAAKITAVNPTPAGAVLLLDNGDSVEVNLLWQDRHRPQVGGYYVVYSDEYASYSPAQAFEEGYSRL